MRLARDQWVWMPHPAHLVVSSDCRFHLATWVGGHIVSTVGEYLPDEGVREIHCQVRGIILEGRGDVRRADFLRKSGFIEIGHNRLYETMVFLARRRPEAEEQCCPYMCVHDGEGERDFAGYNTASDAYRGHLTLCEKWAEQEGE
jgi:hypothetical protein